MLKNQNAVGALFIVFASACFAMVPFMAKSTYDEGANALGMLSSRFAMSAILMIVLRLIFVRNTPWPRRQLLPDLLSLGFVGLTICALAYFTAIRDIDTSLAIVIFYCNPVMVVLTSWLIYKKKPTKSIVYALIFTMVGVGITTGEIGSGSTRAIVLVLISSLAYVFFALGCSRSLKHTDMFTGVTFVNIGAALGFNLVAFVSPVGLHADYPDTTKGWLIIVALAIVGTVFPTTTFFMGLTRIGTNMTSIYTTSEPVFGIAMGVLVLNERLSLNSMIGATFVIGALLMLSVVESRSETVTAHQ
ncbi:MAG: DMT family transporter [Ilumatobacteraceae bacterium]